MKDKVMMTQYLFGDDTRQVATRTIFWVVVLALLFRIFILALNGYWDHPPYWGVMARKALAIAMSDFGAIPLSSDFQNLYHATAADALRSWQLNDRGLTLLYVAINKIIGHVSYLHVKFFHLVLDALMVIPVMWISNRIAGLRGAVVSGVAYALFLPQAQMAVSPDYNSWLGGIMITMTWLAIILADVKRRSTFFTLIGLLIVVNFIGNEFRSIVALFAFGAAGWLWLVEVGACRSLLLPLARWKPIMAMAFVGIAVLMLAASLNHFTRGEFSPVRSSFGHAFFTGVGQYENPIGMRDSDAAPADWYTRETRKSDTNSTLDPVYNKWLKERAKEFVLEYPMLYSSMVAKRALRILFPNMAFTFVTDLPSYIQLPHQLELVEMRKSLIANHGWLSMITFVQLIKQDPVYIIGLACRVLLLVVLPIGIVSAVWLARSRAAAIFATLPLAYGILTLSFVYVTPPVVTGLHSAVLAVSASGLYLLTRRIREWVGDPHSKTKKTSALIS